MLGPSVCETLCVPFKSRVSVSSSPVEFYTQVLLVFKANCFWRVVVPPSNATPSGWGSELSLLRENFSNMIIFQFVDHTPTGYGVSLYHKSAPPTILL